MEVNVVAVDCLSDQQLIDLVEQRLSPAERRHLFAHIERCPGCRGALGDIEVLRETASRATREVEPEQLGASMMVDEFCIVRLLGCGGMGSVFLAEDTLLKRPVAIKLLHRHLPSAQVRTLQEARVIASVKHPNVIAIYSVGRYNDRPYLISEYIQGRSLAERQRPLPLAEALTVIRAVGLGLEAAHSRGVLHCDIKPGNVMISDSGEVKLIDFGLASPLADVFSFSGSLAEEAETSRTVAGTPAYMAPELWRGEAATVRSDLYALGALLFELCAGRPPHLASDLHALSVLVREERPPPLRSLAPRVSRQVAAAVARCLELNPEARPRSVSAFLAALEARPNMSMLRLRNTALALLTTVSTVALPPLPRARPSPRPGMVRFDAGVSAPGWTVAASHEEFAWCMETMVEQGARCSIRQHEDSIRERLVHIDAFDLDRHEARCLDYASALRRRGLVPRREWVKQLGQILPVVRDDHDGALLAVLDSESCLEARGDGVGVREGQQNHPIHFVTHAGATRYCGWLSRRLPSEAEWMLAAGPNRYPWGMKIPTCQEVLYARSEERPCERLRSEQLPPVGSMSLDVTAEGIHDLGGSVSEWVSDEAVEGGGRHVLRGGNFVSELQPSKLRAISGSRDEVGIANGFRCAASVKKDP